MKTTRSIDDLHEKYSMQEYLDLIARRHVAEDEPLYNACQMAWPIHARDELPTSTSVAYLLSQIGSDDTTLTVCLLSLPEFFEGDNRKLIESRFDSEIVEMTSNVCRLHEFNINNFSEHSPEQTESIRRMLLSMVGDIRVVLIKLAFRVERMKLLKYSSEQVQKAIALESLEIFAPIANRLGIGQLKWEIEDLAFRYLEPDTYKQVAMSLDEKRVEREQYVDSIVSEITGLIEQSGIHGHVYGRPKHIYSIWKKMVSKNRNFDELFDVRAVRITVETVAECYAVLGLVHGRWRHIEKEFDDYIANPKENGYQSLHTAVHGPGGKPVEIQIRTEQMHEFAEHGVAAHWRYKEGGGSDSRLEANISSLRKLLENDEEDAEGDLVDNFRSEFFPDRVFILTPEGRVIDLPQGATPVDFAYAVHTEVGHRCRGAKVNGNIVQLTHQLCNGERVEILTTKDAHPRRDWLIPHLGYTVTTRARNRIRSWYRKQDKGKNTVEGKAMLERELKKLGIRPDAEWLLSHFKKDAMEDLYLSIGQGDINNMQMTAALHEFEAPNKQVPGEEKTPRSVRSTQKNKGSSKIDVVGVGNLLTGIAKCCNPLPGDEIIGFITLGKGVSVHRKDCKNIINLKEESQSRLIEVAWGVEDSSTYPANLIINAVDRQGLLSDVTRLLSDERVNVIAVNTLSDKGKQMARMQITVEISDLQQLTRLIDKINQLPNIIEVLRGANN